jgi:hypothetical protein
MAKFIDRIYLIFSLQKALGTAVSDSRGLLYADLQLPKTSNNGSMKVKNHHRHLHNLPTSSSSSSTGTSSPQQQWSQLNRTNFSDRSLDQTIDTLDTSLDRSHSKVDV